MVAVIQDRRGPSGRHNLVTQPREGRPSTFEVCKNMPELTLESIGFVEVSFSRAAAGLAGGGGNVGNTESRPRTGEPIVRITSGKQRGVRAILGSSGSDRR